MFKWFKRMAGAEPEAEVSEENPFLKTVYAHAVDRRQYVRVKYPVVGAIGGLPKVELDGVPLIPENVSLGGVLLVRPPVPAVSDNSKVMFKFIWSPGIQVHQGAVLLRRSGGDMNWHFQFQRPDIRFQNAFPKLFYAGLRGTNVGQMKPQDIPASEKISELWISATGEFILFENLSGTQETSFIGLDKIKVQYVPRTGLVHVERNKDGSVRMLHKANQMVADQCIVFLTNVQTPSERVQWLLAELLAAYYNIRLKSA